jgi:hypothetical protein
MVCAPRERQAQLERVRDGLNLGKARNAYCRTCLPLPVYGLLRHRRRESRPSRYAQTYFTYKIKYLIY